MNKDSIRLRVKARKSLLDENERASAARRVFDLVENTAAFMLAEHILMYHSLPDELSTREFIDRWSARKRFYLPRVNGVNLDILPYDRSRLHLGAFNIEEPTGDETADINDIELIIVPGVAYDRRGNRIGRGKGYYDRLLRDTRAVTIGVAYSCQLCDDIEPDEFDVPVNYVITEDGIIKIS
ncbi:MAG: 5-formyltetrahydrofolate cyclo-ligase [Muribaculaceae bacterium]|nr:5-formyltetrahydrofolate cyclo-ligase [Muribaculaceae bacterium]